MFVSIETDSKSDENMQTHPHMHTIKSNTAGWLQGGGVILPWNAKWNQTKYVVIEQWLFTLTIKIEWSFFAFKKNKSFDDQKTKNIQFFLKVPKPQEQGNTAKGRKNANESPFWNRFELKNSIYDFHNQVFDQ